MPEYPNIDTEREHLRDYLNQYAFAISEKHRLERRASQIRWDMTHLHGRRPQQALSKRTRRANGDGEITNLVDKADELERQIAEQTLIACGALLCVFDAMDYLPLLSMERTVLEIRYIDRSTWPSIAKTTGLSRSSVFDYYNAGLDRLLCIPAIQARVAVYVGDTGPLP